MLAHYIVLAGKELSNFARFKAYRDNGWGDSQISFGSDCCVLPLLCDIPTGGENVFDNPVADDAPWYNSSIGDSQFFGGFLATKIDGLGSVITADSGNGVTGGWVGSQREGLRTLTITGVLQAQSCCGLQYGLRWLESSIRGTGGCFGDGCDGSDMFLYDCPPSEDDLLNLTSEQILNKYLRKMFGIKYLKGVEVLSTEGSCCGNNCGGLMAVVQFTLGVEKSGIYTLPKMGETLNLVEECFCALSECVECSGGPTKIVEVETNKTRLPIRVKDDGSWCPIGWTFDEYDIDDGTNYLDVSDISSTRRPYYISVKYDGSWSTMGWDANIDTDYCLLDVQIGEICSDPNQPTEQGCSAVSGVENRQLPIDLTVNNSGGGVWAADGWVHNPADFVPTLSELVLNLDCDDCFENGLESAEINVNDDGSWNFMNGLQVSDLWRFDSLSIIGFSSGTYLKQVEVAVNELVPPCYENVESIDLSLPSVEDCYCEPIIYSQQCHIIDLAATGELKNYVVSQLTAVEDLENVSFEIFYSRYNNFPDPCGDDVISRSYWHCKTACAGWHAAKLYAGMVVDYDSALSDLSIHGGRFESSKWLGLDGFASFGDCGYVVVRVKAQCKDFDTLGNNGVTPNLSFNVGTVAEYNLGIS